MAEEKVINSYLYELKPYVNTSAWKKASGEISSIVKSTNVTYSDWETKKKEYQATMKEVAELEKSIDRVNAKIKATSGKEQEMWKKLLGNKVYRDEKGKLVQGAGMLGELERLKTTANEQQTDAAVMEVGLGKTGKVAGEMAKFASGITSMVGVITAVVNSFKLVLDTSNKLVNKATEMSNKLNTSGAFGDMGIRSLKSRYGVSVTRANAMNVALSQLGLSEDQIGRMNNAQRKAYDELIAHYEKGINKIDVQKLDEYNKAMEEFQMATAKWKIDLQTSAMKVLAESDALKRLTGTLSGFFEKVISFVESPAVQWFFDTFVSFLETIIDIAGTFMDVVGGLVGTSTNNTTNNTTNNNSQSTNNVYVYGSEHANNEGLARNIALKLQTSSIG